MANRPLVFGVLNVTPDSYSDGGLWDSPENAIEHARAMVADGGDVIDVSSGLPGPTPSSGRGGRPCAEGKCEGNGHLTDISV